jgi:hypothetical protein
MYPGGSTIRFDADFSNQNMDAQWNFDGNGEPMMHSLDQGTLLRQSGWMEQSWLQRGRQAAWFILFDSSYGTFANGRLGNSGAYLNLQYMLTAWWHAKDATQQPQNILPSGATGRVDTSVIPKLDDGPFLVISAWWGNQREIEAIAFATPKLLTRTRLREMLEAQVRAAVGMG